jgi:AcrR family transcriptional regulator
MATESANRIVQVDGRRRRPWALVSQENLLRAAIDEIAAVGFAKARLIDIAKRAGMTAGSVYTWFENKEDLFQAALQHSLTEQLRKNAEALEKADFKDSFLLQLATLVPRNYKDTGPTDTQQLLIECYYAAWRDPDAREALMNDIESHRQMYISIFEMGQKEGFVTKDMSAVALGTLILSIHTGLAMLSLAGVPRIDDKEWITIYGKMAEAFQ